MLRLGGSKRAAQFLTNSGQQIPNFSIYLAGLKSRMQSMGCYQRGSHEPPAPVSSTGRQVNIPLVAPRSPRQIPLSHTAPTSSGQTAFHHPSCYLRPPAISSSSPWRRVLSTRTAAAAAGLSASPAQPLQLPLPASLSDLRAKLQFYNTMSRQKEVFKPRSDMGDKVQMYVCGVTVYDYSHIGHARVYVAFDVLYRLLRQLGYDVQYVRNFTDIDDKIINRAKESGEDPLALAGRFVVEFHEDMHRLGCLDPSLEPKATEFIKEMVDTIQAIISNGHAYALDDGDVYFDVASLPGYGRLSGRSQEDNRAGERVAVDGRKRSPADFALWKAAKPGEPSWESPWGAGRPGWHIECSSMIRSVMGPVIDIHGGGRDLVFPHHENELAQSQAAASCCCEGGNSELYNGTDFVRYWLHNGFVNVDSEKMSKSLGNFFTIRDVLELYHPMALRWFLVGSQYRAPINYTQRALDEGSDRVYYVYQTLAEVEGVLAAAGDEGVAAAAAAEQEAQEGKGPAAELLAAVVEPLLDDLNTPVAVSALSAPLKAANDLMTTKAGRKNPKRLQLLAGYQLGIRGVAGLLGLQGDQVHHTLEQLRQRALKRAGITAEEVEVRMAARAEARKAKDFAAADGVRQELEQLGIWIMDSPQGTTWRPGLPALPAAETEVDRADAPTPAAKA